MEPNSSKYYYGDYIIAKTKSLFVYNIAKQSKKGKLPKVLDNLSYTTVDLAKRDIDLYLASKRG